MPNGWHGPWSGRGSHAHLPPWRRRGWLCGKAACWWRWGPYKAYPPLDMLILKPEDEIPLLAEQKTLMEEQLKAMQETLQKIQARIDKLKAQP